MGRPLCIYSHEFYPKRGGIATYCQEFAQAAGHAGYKVSLYAPDYAASAGLQNAPFALRTYKNTGTLNPICIWRTRQLLLKTLHKEPDCIHLFAEPGPILAFSTLPKIRASGPVVIVLHGSEIARWRSHMLTKRLVARAFEQADTIITVSKPIHKMFVEAFPEAAQKAQTIYSALPEKFIEQSHQDKDLTNETARPFNLLSVGRIHPRKNFGDLITALSKLQSSSVDEVHLTIAGSVKKPAYLEELKSRAKRYNVHVNWFINPSDDELMDCYRRADAFALMSRQIKNSIEGYGLVFLEAGSFGLPCIAYAEGGVVDAIEDEKTGFLVASGDTDALATRIVELIKSPDLRAQLGEANRAHTFSRTWTDVVSETLQTLN